MTPYLDPAARKQLKLLAPASDEPVHALLFEAVDHLFRKRGKAATVRSAK